MRRAHPTIRIALSLALWLAAAVPASAAGDGVVEITLLQLNDVYEILPVSLGQEGGLARVAAVRKALLAENPNTFTLLAGDFLTTSVMEQAVVDGKPLAGKQMVAVFKAMGLDFATFGNRELRLPEDAFRERLAQAAGADEAPGFTWIASNVFDARRAAECAEPGVGRPFPGVLEHAVIEVRDGDDAARLGIFGLTITGRGPDYVCFRGDYAQVAREQVRALREEEKADVVVALTHLELADDERMAIEVPGIDLVVGGHEHSNFLVRRGAGFTPIAKADAEARTVYVHQLTWDARKKRLTVDSRLVPVNAERQGDGDPEVKRVVDEWADKAFAGFPRADARRKVATTDVVLDGRLDKVCNGATNLTELVGQGMLALQPEAEVAVFNCGAIRFSEMVPPGEVTVYDVMRIMPFGNEVWLAEVTGDLLAHVVAQGEEARNSFGYLQVVKREGYEEGRDTYKVAITDYLLSGRERHLKDLVPENPNVLRVEQGKATMWDALILRLEKRFGPR